MTVPLPTPSNPKMDAAAVRKRRRRAPAGGAADDCFTCTKRGVKCDRRRPYCSQCLEVGNECSGYKTQLTWGVGVASRGKLRGLSLPIAKSPPVNTGVKKSGATSPVRARANSSVSSVGGHAAAAGHWNEVGAEELSPRSVRSDVVVDGPVEHQHAHHYAVSMPTTPFGGFDLSRISHAEPTPPIPAGPAHWNHHPLPAYSPPGSLPGDGPRFPKLGPILIHPHHHAHHAHHEPLSSSIDSLSEADYMSPLSNTFSRDDLPFVASPTHIYAESYHSANSPVPQSPVASMLLDHHQRAPTSCPSLVYAPSEPASSIGSFEPQHHLSTRLNMEYEPLATPGLDAYSSSAHSERHHFWGPSPPEEMSNKSIHETWPVAEQQHQPVLPVNQDLIAKIPFFMDYYENTMCPGMVFIDGPHNPFREHIISLAATSRSLQHAICALSACNLRMKRKLTRLAQHHHHSNSIEKATAAPPIVDDRALSEEYQHRNLAVHLLNEQLNDPSKARGDAVLATILLLCHYRMAESGIAKFHTQFAGVKKILGMRRSSPFPPSRDSAWMEALFTYFDAISASINDREAQLNASFYGVQPDAQLLPPGAENLVGCDRELFKTIVKLGRLNLLSQHRPVSSPSSTNPASTINTLRRSQSPLESPLGHIYKSSQHQQQQQHHDLFGHHHLFGAPLNHDEPSPSSSAQIPTSYDDHRSTFWREWKDARIALQSWEFDAARLSSLSSLSPTPPSPAQIRDLAALSEAFRYAALLYTERLASPHVAASHANFRNLVSQVVYYATSLEDETAGAEKFLLWPLFVAGSECVNEVQQGIIRGKCREIMGRSGYMNNLAALDVLERIWAGEGRDGMGEGGGLGSLVRRAPFSWTRCIGGPGVEVEWIMF